MRHGHEYSIYSDAPASRIGVYGVIGVTAVTIIGLIRGAVVARFARAGEPVPDWFFYVGAVTPLVLFGLLVLVFDRFAWHWMIARPVYWLARDATPPYIHGDYLGTVTWKNQEASKEEKSEASVHIIQRWQRLVVLFDFWDEPQIKRASSHSDMATIVREMDDNKLTLQYAYSYEANESTPDGGTKRAVHHGTAVLDFVKLEGLWNVNGYYYSDDTGSGRIVLKQVP